MNRNYLVLVAVVLLAALLMARATEEPAALASPPASPPPAEDHSSAAMPTPQVLIGQPPGSEPLPDGCSPERAVGIVLAFVDAFNQGDEARLAALFTPDVRDADGTPDPGDQWRNSGSFSVFGQPGVDAQSDEDGLAGVFARNDEEMVEWTVVRHAHGEHWTLLKLFMGGYWWKGGVIISVEVRQEADDLPTRIVGGKGAIICNSSRDGTVFLWNMGGPSALPDELFEPGATPEAVSLTHSAGTS